MCGHRMCIAPALDRLEAHAKGPFTVHASITAKPFFEAGATGRSGKETVERRA